MNKLFMLVLIALGIVISSHAVQARGRYGSTRIGGYTSSGKGSHYIGGYIRSCHGIFCR